MNQELERVAREVRLDDADCAHLRFEFGYDCASRVRHLLEDQGVIECLDVLGRYVQGSVDVAILVAAADRAAQLCVAHPGSKSIDGCGHAAVSASYAVAKALAGKAIQAADYAAYAAVYGQGGYGAVADRASFNPEFAWQAQHLASLAMHDA